MMKRRKLNRFVTDYEVFDAVEMLTLLQPLQQLMGVYQKLKSMMMFERNLHKNHIGCCKRQLLFL